MFQQTLEGAQQTENYGLRGILHVPDDAMYSYQDRQDGRSIAWGLEVSGRVAGLPYGKMFPVIVARPRDFDT